MNLNQITLPSLDVEKATAFYKSLGFHLIVDALPQYVRFECPEGDSTFSIQKVKKLPTGVGITVYFENDNLNELVYSLKQKGVVFASELQDKSWLWREAHLNDLDGNHLVLYNAGKNRKNPPWRIK